MWKNRKARQAKSRSRRMLTLLLGGCALGKPFMMGIEKETHSQCATLICVLTIRQSYNRTVPPA